MTTMHLIPIAPAPPRTPGKLSLEATLTSLSPSAAAKCVLLPLQPAVISESEMQSSAIRLQGLVSAEEHIANNSNNNKNRCKKKINFGGLSYTLPKPQSAAVVRRNERERNRVRKVNVGFAKLRDHVPGGAKNKKLSKVETLRSAVEYISMMQKMLEEDGAVVRKVGASDASTKTSNASCLPIGSSNGSNHHCAGSLGSVCSTSDSVSIVDSVCSPSSSIDTMGQSPEHYTTDDSPSPPPSSADPISPDNCNPETDFFDFTAWLVQS